MATGLGVLIAAGERDKLVALLHQEFNSGASAKAIVDLIGSCSRMLRLWGIALQVYGFS